MVWSKSTAYWTETAGHSFGPNHIGSRDHKDHITAQTTGANNAVERDVVDAHYKACLFTGIYLCLLEID